LIFKVGFVDGKVNIDTCTRAFDNLRLILVVRIDVNWGLTAGVDHTTRRNELTAVFLALFRVDASAIPRFDAPIDRVLRICLGGTTRMGNALVTLLATPTHMALAVGGNQLPFRRHTTGDAVTILALDLRLTIAAQGAAWLVAKWSLPVAVAKTAARHAFGRVTIRNNATRAVEGIVKTSILGFASIAVRFLPARETLAVVFIISSVNATTMDTGIAFRKIAACSFPTIITKAAESLRTI